MGGSHTYHDYGEHKLHAENLAQDDDHDKILAIFDKRVEHALQRDILLKLRLHRWRTSLRVSVTGGDTGVANLACTVPLHPFAITVGLFRTHTMHVTQHPESVTIMAKALTVDMENWLHLVRGEIGAW